LILIQEWKKTIWDKFVMGAPRPRSQAKLQYNPKTLAISEKDMGGQIKGYLSICGKEQSVRKDWYFSI
jgi:hypothetical protein